jgi:hypothetical protein
VFCLGLSFLHLLTGNAPYEELMKDIHCPSYLKERLVKLWKCDEVINDVIESLVDDNDDEEDGEDEEKDDHSNNTSFGSDLFSDTIYRFLVLFSSLTSFQDGFLENSFYYNHSFVWKDVMEGLGLSSSSFSCLPYPTAALTKKAQKQRDSCILQFQKDKNQWSFFEGNHLIIVK